MADIIGTLTGQIGALIGANSATTASSIAQQLVTQVALGAASSAILASIQHPDVQKALNPLGLTLPIPIGGSAPAATPAPAPAPAPVVVPATPAKPTITAAVFNTLNPGAQAAFLAAGGMFTG